MGLKERIDSGQAVLGVVGLGYVGLPLAVEMAKAGHRVVGIDISAEKVALVNAGKSYIPDVPTEEMAPLVAAGLITATTDFSARPITSKALVISSLNSAIRASARPAPSARSSAWAGSC